MAHDDNETLPDDDTARLSPLLDGELNAAEAQALRAKMATDPVLANAYGRLERLSALSRAALAAPAVSGAEWQASAERVLRGSQQGGTSQARILTMRRSVLRFAVAAIFLIAATLTLPFIPSGEVAPEHGRIPIARTPGANDFEVLEAWNDRTDYYIWLDYPSEPTDAVVIMVSKT